MRTWVKASYRPPQPLQKTPRAGRRMACPVVIKVAINGQPPIQETFHPFRPPRFLVTPIQLQAVKALQAFLHPLTGGPGRDGWPFGRDVYRSDVAAVLAAVAGVDYVASLKLSTGDPSGEPAERIQVPKHCMVVAGHLDVKPTGSEG